MSYRPITDVWLLTRPKVKYHGAYPSGFLHRARQLLGVKADDAVLHVCAGMIRAYPYRGLGLNDKTLDLDPALSPDFLQDARDPLPLRDITGQPWDAVLIDRPYTEADAEAYEPGAEAMPELGALTRRALGSVVSGGRVGVLDYQWPHPGKAGREVAVVAVGTGRNGRARWFTVFERLD